MTTYKTSELEGEDLDAAVALAEGWQYDGGYFWAPGRLERDGGYEWPSGKEGGCLRRPDTYSKTWEHAGPLIERERIALIPPNGGDRTWWTAGLNPTVDNGAQCESGWLELPEIILEHEQLGPTPLIAAMRVYVASRLSETVELP